ncbi:MAG: hypothetical protein NVSMB49_12320 [Ktedonobacteraceae bacterium]
MNALIDAPKTTLARGLRLGHYIIRRLLQSGGMSSVYLAYDEYTYTTVAIKVMEVQHTTLSESLEGNDQFAQFRRERRIMKSLRHDHILPLLAAGRQGSYAYLVMPYVQGGTLRERLERGPLAPEEAFTIFTQLADALSYMHECGILHRDIKPANILLNENGSVYLADFGIAAYIDESAIERNGHVMGTPMYMAPELCYGHASVGSDIYALGILLYQMLTGQVPFEGTDSWGVCMRQIEELPMQPSQLNPLISCAVEQVILRALEKDVTLRFATVEAFATAYEKACNSSLVGKVQGMLTTFVASLAIKVQSAVSFQQSREAVQSYITEAVVAW